MFLLIALMVVVLVFGAVVFVGAPYLPTFNKQIEAAFELLELEAGQTMIELGSGDGKVLLAAGKRGVHAIGYELNPILVLISRVRTWRYRKLVTVKWRNFWTTSLPEADAIFIFLLDKYMKKLDKKIIQEYSSGVRLASFAFKIPGRKASKQKNGVYLYIY